MFIHNRCFEIISLRNDLKMPILDTVRRILRIYLYNWWNIGVEIPLYDCIWSICVVYHGSGGNTDLIFVYVSVPVLSSPVALSGR